MIATLTSMLTLAVCLFAAYPLARHRFPGRKRVLIAALGVTTLPHVAVLSGMFELIRVLDIYNEKSALILAYMIITVPFTLRMTTLIGRKGSILVEFAIGVPLLLICAAAMHDLPKYARMQSKMEFCAHCMVNMIQNVSMNRENKKVTLQDFKYISCAASFPYFGGGIGQYGEYPIDCPLKHHLEMALIYVKGVGPNKAKMIWQVVQDRGEIPPERKTITVTSGHTYDYVTIMNGDVGSEYDSHDIYEGLNIKQGEVKMIVDICLWPGENKPQTYGMYLMKPKKEGKSVGYFHSVVIFTPKPGLFSETPPS